MKVKELYEYVQQLMNEGKEDSNVICRTYSSAEKVIKNFTDLETNFENDTLILDFEITDFFRWVLNKGNVFYG